jgi:hypothetical protein
MSRMGSLTEGRKNLSIPISKKPDDRPNGLVGRARVPVGIRVLRMDVYRIIIEPCTLESETPAYGQDTI